MLQTTGMSEGDEGSCRLTLHSQYLRPSTDGRFLTYPRVFPGCITKAICATRSDWSTAPSLPEKLNIRRPIISRHANIRKYTLSNEIAFVIQPGKTHTSKCPHPSSDGGSVTVTVRRYKLRRWGCLVVARLTPHCS